MLAIGAGLAMIAGIGPGIGEGYAGRQGLRGDRPSAGVQGTGNLYDAAGLCRRGDDGYLRLYRGADSAVCQPADRQAGLMHSAGEEET